MLHAQEGSEQEPAGKVARPLPGQHKGGNQETVHAPIVLEVNVVNDQQPRRQQNRNGSSLGGPFGSAVGGVDKPWEIISTGSSFSVAALPPRGTHICRA